MFKNWSLKKVLPWLLIVGGIVGIVASFFLVYDQIQIWKHPNYVPFCSLNPIVNCGQVISSKQGEILGIPPPFFGLAVFPVFVTVGVALLAGAQLKRWFWQLLEVGVLGGVAFALWLFWLSLYRVHALCPFCLSVDAAMYVLVWYVSLYNLQAGHITLPKRLTGAGKFAKRHHLDILVLWFLIVIAYILHHFWYYYGKHL